jgi:hypothetical protein
LKTSKSLFNHFIKHFLNAIEKNARECLSQRNIHRATTQVEDHWIETFCFGVLLRLSLLAYMYSDPHLKKGRNAMFQAMGIFLLIV